MYMLEFYNKSIFVFQKQIQHHTVSFQVILCWFVYSFVSFIRYIDLLLFNFKLAVFQLYSSLAQGFISNTRNYGITCNLLIWLNYLSGKMQKGGKLELEGNKCRCLTRFYTGFSYVHNF